MNELSLFTGAGGGVLGTQHLLGWRAVGYVEYDAYCQAVLKARITDGVLHDAPIFGDIREFISSGCAEAYRGMVDVISAGFPCQPFSVAGKQRGADDERNMWPATIECIRVVRPRFAFLENVPGLLNSGYFGTIIADLAASGYDARWRVLSAAEVGAPHRRERLWIVADTVGEQKHKIRRVGEFKRTAVGRDIEAAFQNNRTPCDHSTIRRRTDVADTSGERIRRQRRREQNAGDRRKDVIPGSEAVADATRDGWVEGWTAPEGQQGRHDVAECGSPLADANDARPQGRDERSECACERAPWACCRAHEDDRLVRSGIRRVSHGVASRVDRLRALGNGQVPLVAATAWRLLTRDIE